MIKRGMCAVYGTVYLVNLFVLIMKFWTVYCKVTIVLNNLVLSLSNPLKIIFSLV